MNHEFVKSNGITLHVPQAGPESAPLLIFLHGFPEFWGGWRRQIPFFVAAGYRLWLPDQRGYGLSEKPTAVRSYNLDELAADVVGLIDAAGVEKAFLVGHDWGGAVAWWTANKYPERIARLGILNVPHHAVMKRYVRKNPGQLRKSWYMFYFQLPGLPEWSLRAWNWWSLAETMRRSSRPGTFSEEELAAYRRAWSQPGAIRGMVNWYRALFRYPPQAPDSPRITVPTLLIWGKGDAFLDWQMAQPSVELCDDGRLVFIDEATHWVQHEAPARVNPLLLDFFREEER